MSETIETKSKPIYSKNSKNTKSKPEILKQFNLMMYSSPKKYFKPPVNTKKKPMTPTKNNKQKFFSSNESNHKYNNHIKHIKQTSYNTLTSNKNPKEKKLLNSEKPNFKTIQYRNNSTKKINKINNNKFSNLNKNSFHLRSNNNLNEYKKNNNHPTNNSNKKFYNTRSNFKPKFSNNIFDNKKESTINVSNIDKNKNINEAINAVDIKLHGLKQTFTTDNANNSNNYSNINDSNIEIKKNFSQKNSNIKKNIKNKINNQKNRRVLSPGINRELLNIKQASILNYSTENRKKFIGSSPYKRKKFNEQYSSHKILKNKQKAFNGKEPATKLCLNPSASNNSNRYSSIENNSDIENEKKIKKNSKIKSTKCKSPQSLKHTHKNNANGIINNSSNNQINSLLSTNERSSDKINGMNISNNNKNKIVNSSKKNSTKKTLNPSKSQTDINPDFILHKLENGATQNIEPPKKNPKSHTSKLIKRMESICKKGYAGPGEKKINQDNYFIYNNFLKNKNYIYVGVCDGHGMYGQDVSGFLVNFLPQSLNTKLLKNNINDLENTNFQKLSTLLKTSFLETNNNLLINDNIDTIFSGSTCSSLIFTPTRLITINLGDSRIILGKFNEKNWSAENLTRDHKPSEHDELNRILNSGGRVESNKDELGEPYGPERVWLKEERIPGLAMSRSFGDEVAHSAGVIAEPEIKEHFLCEEDKFIIIASDGIWEFVSSEECVSMVKNFYMKDDIDGALFYVYKESSKKWILEEEVIDDITLIIIFLN